MASRKCALVTGGSAGIGAAVARLLADNGYRVAINYASNRQRAEQTLGSLEGEGHCSIQGSVFERDTIASVVTAAREKLGALDVVISNAGWTAFGAFNDLDSVSDHDWEHCYRTNVLSHLWLMQACRGELEKRKGVFVISASVSGLKPSGSSMAYSVSKSGTIHLMKSLAVACAPLIRVNAVAAGVMMTDWSKGFSEGQIASVTQANALGQITDVADVAAVYMMLCRNTSMTGQCIEVSSGFRL